MASSKTSKFPILPSLDILGSLSSGGMGEVLLARKRGVHGFNKLVAVKTIRADLISSVHVRKMFLDEARLLALLDHPAIAQVHDFGEANGVLYLAMEYIAGVPFHKIKKRSKPLPFGIVAQLISEAARGLHAAHEITDLEGKSLKVVHRDISPQNLMLTFDGRVKVLDFGIALMRGRLTDDTVTGFVKGKLSYVAPEQVLDRSIDRRTDIFQLCVVFHEMLTGERLFPLDGSPAVEALKKRKKPARPSQVCRGIPKSLDSIVLRGLAENPDQRFANAKLLAVAIEEFLRKVKVETLEEFADRELKTEKRDHRARLHAMIEHFAEDSSLEEAKANVYGPSKNTKPNERPPPLPAITVSDFVSIEEVKEKSSLRRWIFAVIATFVCFYFGAQIFGSKRDQSVAVQRDQRPHTSTSTASLETLIAAQEARMFGPEEPTDLHLVDVEETDRTSTIAVSANLQIIASSSIAGSDSVAGLGDRLEEKMETDKSTGSIAETIETEEKIYPKSAPATSPFPDRVDAKQSDQRISKPKILPKENEHQEIKEKSAKSKVISTNLTRSPKKEVKPAITSVRKGSTSVAEANRPSALTINARANGTIWVDGRKAGATPLLGFSVSPGRHEVALRRPGDSQPRWKRNLNLLPGKKYEITLR